MRYAQENARYSDSKGRSKDYRKWKITAIFLAVSLMITGGKQSDLFYRNSDGESYGHYIDDKPHELIVWTR